MGAAAHACEGSCRVNQCLFVSDRESYEAAAELIAVYGEHALSEAAARADRSRDLGNHIHYARWCRVGRTILLLGDPGQGAPLH